MIAIRVSIVLLNIEMEGAIPSFENVLHEVGVVAVLKYRNTVLVNELRGLPVEHPVVRCPSSSMQIGALTPFSSTPAINGGREETME